MKASTKAKDPNNFWADYFDLYYERVIFKVYYNIFSSSISASATLDYEKLV